MHDALNTHNEIMRELIEKHQGYEVKTQGDSFMVAFQDPQSAVEWSLDVQEALLEEKNWPPDILEQKSGEIVRSQTEVDDDGEPLLLFRGLRVRIGMHTGFPELEYNPRTDGVDYFGPTVNCAARIEALGAGGQVLCSVETQSLLTDESRLVLTFLGRFPLKGMSVEQEIVQLSSHRLALRQFPEIDRVKLEVQKAGPQACEVCNRPLQCLKCLNKNSKKGGAADGVSASNSFVRAIGSMMSMETRSRAPFSARKDNNNSPRKPRTGSKISLSQR